MASQSNAPAPVAGMGDQIKKCRWCESTRCTHCKCPGYAGCGHAKGDQCPNIRYRNRSNCNTCARKKFEYKHLVEPIENYFAQMQPPTELDLNTPMQSVVHSFTNIDAISNNQQMPLFAPLEVYIPSMSPRAYPSLSSSVLLESASRFSDHSSHPVISFHSMEEFMGSYCRRSLDPFYATSGGTPRESTPRETSPRTQYIHINLMYNVTPVFVVPVNLPTDKLDSVRRYIELKFPDFNMFPFKFVSLCGVIIDPVQESDFLVDTAIAKADWFDPVQKENISRSHLIIQLIEDETSPPVFFPSRKRPACKESPVDVEKAFLDAPIQDQERLALIVYSGFHYNIRDNYDGRPLLLRAAYNNLPRAVNIVLLSGGDINVQYFLIPVSFRPDRDREGNTALHIAASRGNYEVLSLLLDKLYQSRPCTSGRPNVFQRNAHGQTPIQVCNPNSPQCFSILRDTMSRYRRVNPSTAVLDQVTRLSDIKCAMFKESSQHPLLSELSFVFEGVHIHPSQEADILAKSLQTPRGFLVWIPPQATNDIVDVSESLSCLSLSSYNKQLSLQGSWNFPILHREIGLLRDFVSSEKNDIVRQQLEDLMASNRKQISEL